MQHNAVPPGGIYETVKVKDRTNNVYQEKKKTIFNPCIISNIHTSRKGKFKSCQLMIVAINILYFQDDKAI